MPLTFALSVCRRDEFAIVLGRLDDFSNSIDTLTELTRHIAAQSSALTTTGQAKTQVPVLSPATGTSPEDVSSRRIRGTAAATAVEHVAIPNEQTTTPADNGGEPTYSLPAGFIMMRSVLKVATDIVSGTARRPSSGAPEPRLAVSLRDSSTQEAMRRKLDQCPCGRRPCGEAPVHDDHSPITSPPRFLVNLFLGDYMRDFNSRVPVFDLETLTRSIDAHYDGRDSDDAGGDAWALILNNIVLLELHLEAQHAHATGERWQSAYNEFFQSFVKNCDRAVSNLGLFMKPSVVNVQALLTLVRIFPLSVRYAVANASLLNQALAVQEIYPVRTGDRIFQVACQVGRAMGIQRRRPLLDIDSAPGERIRLYSVLYSVDKQRALTSGHPCDMYLFESDIDLVDCGSAGGDPTFADAFNRLMMIWEEIYLSLYCPRALAFEAGRRRAELSSVQGSFDQWRERYSSLLETTKTDQRDQEAAALGVELRYMHHATEVLILRCGSQHGDDAKRQVCESARKALSLTSCLMGPPTTKACLAALGRVFRSSTAVCCTELIAYHVGSLARDGIPDPRADADLALLGTVRQHLTGLQHADFPLSYHTRIEKSLSWAWDILSSLKSLAQPPQAISHPAPAEATEDKPPPAPMSPASLEFPGPVGDVDGSIGWATNFLDALHTQPATWSLAEAHHTVQAGAIQPGELQEIFNPSFDGGPSALEFIRGACMQGKWNCT